MRCKGTRSEYCLAHEHRVTLLHRCVPGHLLPKTCLKPSWFSTPQLPSSPRREWPGKLPKVTRVENRVPPGGFRQRCLSLPAAFPEKDRDTHPDRGYPHNPGAWNSTCWVAANTVKRPDRPTGSTTPHSTAQVFGTFCTNFRKTDTSNS